MARNNFDSRGASSHTDRRVHVPPSPPLARRRTRTTRAGLTLIEAALLVALIGVLLAAFIPTFVRHVHTSKLAEAVERLASLHEHAAAYYERRQASGLRCLPESAGPYPATPSSEPVAVDFAADATGAATWSALGQAPGPLRYSYEIEVPEPGCRARPSNVPAITLRAHGDLDGDGELSLLERSAAPSADGRALKPYGPLRVVARTE